MLNGGKALSIWQSLSLLAISLLPFQPTAVAAPGNDNFQNATFLEGVTHVLRGTLQDASLEPGEVHNSPFGTFNPINSTWYRWVAPAHGTLELSAVANTLPTLKAVLYSGSDLAGLQYIGHVEDHATALNVVESSTYHLALIGAAPAPEMFLVGLHFEPAPGNDHFLNATRVEGRRFTIEGHTRGATAEVLENPFPELHTIWWKWTAPETGLLWWPVGAPADLWRGDTVENAQNFTYPAVQAGETYHIRAGSWGRHRPIQFEAILDTGRVIVDPAEPFVGQPFTLRFVKDPERPDPLTVTLHLGFMKFPVEANNPALTLTNVFPGGSNFISATVNYPDENRSYQSSFVAVHRNDHFADATMIPPEGGLSSIPTFKGATVQQGEPSHNPSFPRLGSLWWKWRPAFSGIARIDSSHNNLVVYTGSDLTNLTRMTLLTAAPRQFNVSEETEYFISLQAPSPGVDSTTSFRLELLQRAPNDFFAVPAQLRPGEIITASTRSATLEIGEKSSFGVSGTLWWTFTAPVAGRLRVQAIDPEEVLQKVWRGVARFEVHAYKGSAVNALTEIATQLPSGDYHSFGKTVAPGESVHLQVSSRSGEAGDFFLGCEFVAFPSKDAPTATEIDRVPFLITNLPRSEHGEKWWWQWTPPADLEVTASVGLFALGSSPEWGVPSSPRVEVYRVTENGELAGAGTTNQWGSHVFTAVKGNTYKIAVENVNGDDVFYLTPKEPHDNRAVATELSSGGGRVVANLFGASHETGDVTTLTEPTGTTLPLVGNVWWKFTPTTDGVLYVSNSVPAVYHQGPEGQLVPAVTERVNKDSVSSYLNVRSNVTYLISQDGLKGMEGVIHSARNTLLDYRVTGFRMQTIGQRLNHRESLNVHLPELDHRFDPALFEANIVLTRKLFGTPEWEISKRVRSLPASLEFADLQPGFYELTGIALNQAGETVDALPVQVLVSPENDSFANRKIISSPYNPNEPVSVSLGGATLEEFEKGVFPDLHGSVWFEWIPSKSERVRIRGGLLAIFKINGGELDLIKPPSPSPLVFAEAGTTYYLAALLDLDPSREELDFSFYIERAPPFDAFALAAEIRPFHGAFYPLTGPLGLSSLEPGEPQTEGETGSLWYSISPEVLTELETVSRGCQLTLWTGDTLETLRAVELIAMGGDTNSAVLLGNTRYYLRVAKTTLESYSYSLSFRIPALNDDFSSSIRLSGVPLTVAGIAAGASMSANEPFNNAFHRSVWYSWRSEKDGPAVARVNARHGLRVFTGNDLGSLMLVEGDARSSEEQSFYAWSTSSNQTYHIQVFWLPDRPLEFSLDLIQPDWDQLTDTFALRPRLTGSQVEGGGHAGASTREPGESPHYYGSLWWSWTVPADGLAVFRSTPGVNVALCRGNALESLQIHWLLPTGGAIPVQKGEEIQVLVTSGLPVEFGWTLQLVPIPSNSKQETAALLDDTHHQIEIVDNALTGISLTSESGVQFLWWKWVPPLGGTLLLEATHPAFRIEGLAGGANVVAGRTYHIQVDPTFTGDIFFDVIPSPVTAALKLDLGRSTFSFEPLAEEGTFFRVDSSDDLLDWQQGEPWLYSGQGQTLELSLDRAHRFFRMIPLN